MVMDSATGLGTLIVTLVADPDSKSQPDTHITLQVVELSLAGDGRRATLVRQRALDLALDAKTGVSFVIGAPAGRWHTLALALRQTSQDASTFKAEFPFEIELRPGESMTLRLAVNVAAANKTWRDLRDLLRVLPTSQDVAADAKVSATGELSLGLALEIRPGNFTPRRAASAPAGALRLPGTHQASFTISGARGSFQPGALVKIRAVPGTAWPVDDISGPFGLPALFARQHALGPAIEVASSSAPAGPLTLTLPYDTDAAATLGIDEQTIVVMQLDDARTLYRELARCASTMRRAASRYSTRSLSTFFVCSSGISIAQPVVRIDASGGPSTWTSGNQTTVAGRAADERARASLLDAVTGLALPWQGGWQALGWFDFERVALQPRSTAVRVRAEVDGLLPHECDFTVRGVAPPKGITNPSRRHGPRLAVGADDVPLVTAVVGASRSSLATTSWRPGRFGSAAGSAVWSVMSTGRASMASLGSGGRCCPSCTSRSKRLDARLLPCKACCRFLCAPTFRRTVVRWRRWPPSSDRPSRMRRASTS